MKEDFKERKRIDQINELARELKRKEGLFSGLENPFSSIQEKMLKDFQDTNIIPNPGDKGTSREGILKKYLIEGRYLPFKYGISEGSSYIMSSSGHISKQADLVIFDALNTPRLFNVGGIQYFPVESVYGIIEVKSNLDSQKTIFDGLDKISSFKKLGSVIRNNISIAPGLKVSMSPYRGFGILFSYDASLKWTTIFDFIKEWEEHNSSELWPNFVVVLNQGIICQVYNGKIAIKNDEIVNIQTPKHWPILEAILLHFYLLLMDLLNETSLASVPLRIYASLPTAVGEHSYRFNWGAFGEVGHCEQHGDFLRKITELQIEKILTACKNTSQTTAIEAINEAYGESLALPRQGTSYPVHVYNPEKLSLPDILLRDAHFRTEDKDLITKSLSYEEITIDEEIFWLPLYYVYKHQLINECPNCMIDYSGITLDEWHKMWAELAQKKSRN